MDTTSNLESRYEKLDQKIDNLRVDTTKSINELAKSINALTITLTRMEIQQTGRFRECTEKFDSRYIQYGEFKNLFYVERKEESTRKHGLIANIRNWIWIVQALVTGGTGYLAFIIARSAGLVGG
jgi:hypothetical protein